MAFSPALRLEAERLAQKLQRGQRGFGRFADEKFWRFRPYQGGEPASLIDWRQSARGDKLYVREREKEVVPTLYLWSDPSARGQTLLLALAHILLNGGANVAWLGQPRNIVRGVGMFETFLRAAEKAAFDPADPCPLLPRRKNGHIVLIGALAAKTELWDGFLRAAAAQGSGGTLLDFGKTDETLRKSAANIGWNLLSDEDSAAPETLLLRMVTALTTD
ncbi:MAG: DUF58 domain-containing protein [Alphaproteobacteria bacterium]|nr:DUF58 domain-containing protein [Alphaproteobacteria bacterium]